MLYHLALAPDVPVTAAAFVTAWNATPACREVAEARLETATAATFDPGLGLDVWAVLGSVALGVAGNAVYDLIKRVLTAQGVRKQTDIVQIEQPDGSRVLVVKMREE